MNAQPGTKDPGGWEGKKQVWPTHWPRVPVAVQLFHPHSRDAGDQKSSAHALHTARCTVRGCTHAVEPVHTSLLHGFPLTANAWPQSALAYCKQPHWPGHMWGGLVWRRMERLQKNPQNSHLVRAAIKSFFSELMHHGQRCLIYHRSQNSYTCDIKIFKLLQWKTSCIPYCPKLPITALFKTRNNGQWS